MSSTPDKTDRFAKTKLVVDTGVQPGTLRFERWEVPDIDMTSYSVYTVVSGDVDRPDLISYKHYNDVNYYWAILLVNGISNPFEQLLVGSVLKIPTLSAILDALQSKMQNV